MKKRVYFKYLMVLTVQIIFLIKIITFELACMDVILFVQVTKIKYRSWLIVYKIECQ